MRESSLPSNPFATRFVSPGKLEWVGAGDTFDQLVSRWKSLKCRASIVGVHGSGKSTLLEHFVPLVSDVVWRRDAEGVVAIDKLSSNVADSAFDIDRSPGIWLQLRKTVSQSMVVPWEKLNHGWLLVIDGYEQLSRLRRAMLIARTSLRGVKLLVTSHRRTILPTLCELSISPSVAKQIVLQLTSGRGDFPAISEAEIQQCLDAHRGNMREVLMDFYDRFEGSRELANPRVTSKS